VKLFMERTKTKQYAFATVGSTGRGVQGIAMPHRDRDKRRRKNY